MLTITLYNQKGEKKDDINVSEKIFGVEFRQGLIHQALVRQHANARLGMIAHTKTKGEVRGGGRKPYRQKGTGRARQGSIRNPHFVGGGVAFGPRNVRNYSRMMPKKQRRLALFSALSEKHRSNNVIALDEYADNVIKTKSFVEMLKNLPIEKDVLIVLSEKNNIMQRSSRNIPDVKTILVNYLNIADLQKYHTVLFMEDALKKMENVFISS